VEGVCIVLLLQSGNDGKCPFCNAGMGKTDKERVEELMRRGVSVKLNFILNHSILIMISISISDLRRQIAGVAFDLAILHRLSMTLKIPQKWHMRGSTGAL